MLMRFHSSYLASGMRGSDFLPHGFGVATDRAARVRAAGERLVAPELLQLLEAQNASLPPSEKRRAHLEALGRPGTVVVVTGQQVGLLLGPLYTFYKAATAIVTAKLLARETGATVVPLFWLQTEDHDFDEIDHCFVPHGEAPLRLRIDSDGTDPRASVETRTLGDDVTEVMAQLGDAFDGLPHAEATLALFAASYRPAQTLAQAFAGVLGALFADEGLLLFDPRHEVVAELARPIHRRALVDAELLERALEARGRALEAAGFDEQVPRRPGTTLDFFHADGPGGPRHRLERCPGGFRLPDGKTLTQAELLAALETAPLCFSTSALLRPLLQDSLLPTAAYVGGPAEIDYFAQVSALYAAFDQSPPLVVPRARFRLVPPSTRRLLAQLGLSSAGEAELADDELLRRVAAPSLSEGPNAQWLAEVEERLARFEQSTPSLSRSIERTRQTVRRALDRLARRHQRALLERDQALATRLERLRSWLFPDGAPQERVYSLPWFLAHAGIRELTGRVLAAVDPLDPTPKDLEA